MLTISFSESVVPLLGLLLIQSSSHSSSQINSSLPPLDIIDVKTSITGPNSIRLVERINSGGNGTIIETGISRFPPLDVIDSTIE